MPKIHRYSFIETHRRATDTTNLRLRAQAGMEIRISVRWTTHLACFSLSSRWEVSQISCNRTSIRSYPPWLRGSTPKERLLLTEAIGKNKTMWLRFYKFFMRTPCLCSSQAPNLQTWPRQPLSLISIRRRSGRAWRAQSHLCWTMSKKSCQRGSTCSKYHRSCVPSLTIPKTFLT